MTLPAGILDRQAADPRADQSLEKVDTLRYIALT